MAFTTYTDSLGLSALANTLLASNSGVNIASGSVTLQASAAEAVNLYDGSIANLGIGAGLLLTSGHAPGLVNDIGWDGTDNSSTSGFNNGDASIDAVVNTVFQTQSYDATTLEFDFTVSDPNATSISFDVVFGSEEYPEWVDQFVDCAVVMVNGVNYALFNHDPNHPLSVISSNLAAGYFQDNAGNLLSIQYDGVSQVLKIVAPINGASLNHIKIGIADTGDHILDSGVFIANLSAGNIPGSGVVSAIGTGTAGDDSLVGSIKDEYFDLQAGNDIVYAGAGDDIVVAGDGNDAVYGGSGADELKGDAGDDLLDGGADIDTAVFAGKQADYTVSYDGSKTTVVSAAEGSDSLFGIEQLKFKDGLFALNNGTLTLVDTSAPVVSNTPGIVAISGIALAGNTLSAIVGDANGIPPGGSVGYAWSSSSDGTNWIDTGVTGSSYTLTEADVGKQFQVAASFIDAGGFAESPVSAAVTVAQATAGITINPMQIDAPAGATVKDPLTTLIKHAVDFGYTPNEAAQAVKDVLGVAAGINLATYDPYAILTQDPGDAGALAFMKIAVQVAMTASVSDPSGINLALAVMNAAAAGTTINLTNAIDLVSAGVDAGSLSVVQGLNKDMADAGDFATIQLVWNDWAGQKDNLKPFLNHIEKISEHINQAPTGIATAQLETPQDVALGINAVDLLAGFSDPDGGVLSVSNLGLDQGGSIASVDGINWIFTPDAGFNGPVELSYTISDGQGADISASVMLIVAFAQAPVDTPATGTLNVSGLAAEGGSLNAVIDKLNDIDGITTVGYLWQELVDNNWTALAGQTSATLAIPDDQSFVGKTVRVVASSTDALGGQTDFVGTGNTIANVNDAPTGGVTISGTAQQGQTLTANSSALADADGMPADGVHYQWYAAGAAINGATGNSYVLGVADVGKSITVQAGYTDLFGSAEAVLSGATVLVTALPGKTLSGTKNADTLTGSEGNDTLSGLAGADTLKGLGGDDRLIGGAGNDALTGGTGKDYFVFDSALGKTNIDSIVDFVSGTDKLELKNAIFSKLVGGALAASDFVAGSAPKALDTSDHILYNTSTGALYYDADGSGKGAAVQFATLVGHPALVASDFVIV